MLAPETTFGQSGASGTTNGLIQTSRWLVRPTGFIGCATCCREQGSNRRALPQSVTVDVATRIVGASQFGSLLTRRCNAILYCLNQEGD